MAQISQENKIAAMILWMRVHSEQEIATKIVELVDALEMSEDIALQMKKDLENWRTL